ncbi:MAG: type IV pilus assembly protein PilM [Candidatus Omnitrophota bacterium]
MSAKEKFSVGFDIGTHSIKLVKLRLVKDSQELFSFALEPIGLNLSEQLKRIKSEQGIESANISVSGAATLLRYINFPKMNEAEMRQALKYEAQKHIPFSTSEINLDGSILKSDLPDNKMLTLIAAVKKELVKERLKLLEDAGIGVNVIDIDSLALINAFNFSYELDDNLKHKAVALVNIGASMTNLNIIEEGIPRLSRDIQVSGNNFTQKLADIFGVDFKSAEALKLNPEKEKANNVAAALEAAFSSMAGEIRTSFDYYESQGASTVARIFLSGGSSLFNGLKDILANLLGIEVVYWSPFSKINLSPQVDAQKVKGLSAQLSVAAGLALR